MKITLLLTFLVLAGCGGVPIAASSEGVGFGSGEDDYKESPCACIEIKQKYKRFYKG